MKHVLFVCTGNICRSPMAEGLFADLVEGRDDIIVASAGIGAVSGQPPSTHSVDCMDERGLDIRHQRSQPLTPKLAEWADYIFVMTYNHLDSILLLFPSAAQKTFLLREFEPGLSAMERDISDPIGLGREAYEACRDQIESAMPSVLRAVTGDADPRQAGPEAWLYVGASPEGLSHKSQLASLLRGMPFYDCGIFANENPGQGEYGVRVLQSVVQSPERRGLVITPETLAMEELASQLDVPFLRLPPDGKSSSEDLSRRLLAATVLCFDPQRVAPGEMLTAISAWLQHASPEPPTPDDTTLDTTTNAPAASHRPTLAETDPEIAKAIELEHQREDENIELIASENFTSRAVMEAQGSCLTNKYAEGYPGKRWYGGCEHVDVIEQLAIDRAKALFGAEFANVQPHSGSQANTAVYFSQLKPGDRILTMDLAHGGHLTHGHPKNFSGSFYEVMHYGVNAETETIDYDDLEAKALEFNPALITIGASAYSRVIDFPRMREVADKVDALLMADMAHIAGLVAAGKHPSPVPYADFTTTTTHKTLRGPRGGLILCNKPEHAKAIDSQVFPGIQGGPLMHVIAAKAVCLHEAAQPAFVEYQEQVLRNAKALCEGLKKNGYRIVSGATENHCFLVDLQPKEITGKDASIALDKAGITVNKNAVPFDKQSPFKAGGIRVGSPAVTTRGMKEDEMFDIANFIHETLRHRDDDAKLAEIRKQVVALTKRFPLPY